MIRFSSFPCWSSQLLLSGLICSATAIVMSGCGAETTPEVVTETGNPPFLDPDRITVALTGTEATVRGEEGAVPPNAAVVVTNTESGESASTSADDDGAFSVTLPAEEGDEFEVQVESENQTQTLELAADTESEDGESENAESENTTQENTMIGSEDTDLAPSCEETRMQLDEQYDDIFEGIDTSCSADSDCVVANPGGECRYWGCVFAVAVSNSGQVDVAERGAVLEEECNASFAARDCVAMVPSCPGGPPRNTACVEGTCTMVDASSTETPPQRSSDGPSFVTTVADIFDAKCTGTCHEEGGLLGGPGGIDPLVQQDLTRENSYATLTQQRSKQLPTMWLVGSGLEDSYLWHKLNDTHVSVGGQGAKMPLTGQLTPEELELVQAWIEGGAAP